MSAVSTPHPAASPPSRLRKQAVLGAHRRQSGQALVFTVLLLAFVLFGFLGFAVDLGRMYLIRGELHVAAESMALAAAQELVGTNASADRAQAALELTQTTGNDNRFNFGGTTIGGESGELASEIRDLDLYATYADAVAGDVGTAGGPEARYLRVRVRADAPLTFWQLLPVSTAGVTSIETGVVAGVSQPVCSACGIEPMAIVPLDPQDTTDFGFIRGARYTLYSQCTGAAPAGLQNTVGAIQYTLLNRTLEDGTDADQQVFKLLAGGIPAPAFPMAEDSNLLCPTIGNTELRLPSVSVLGCNAINRGSIVRDTICGLNARLTPTPPAACEAITDVGTLIASFPPDTDLDNRDDYAEYAGNRRRILTVAVVDSIPFAVDGVMTVLGFRQFLLNPNPDAVELNPSDPVARFVGIYVGYPAPVKQGRLGACGVTQGPGKVVLH